MKKYFALTVLIFMAFFSKAQIEEHDIDIMKEMAQEEQEIIEALALYPREIRELIFEASTAPEVIIKLASAQSRTSKQFKDLMLKYPEEVQKDVWEMTRYPSLIGQLAKNPEHSEKIITQYPEQIHEKSRAMVKNQLALLKEIARLEALSQSTFERVVNPLPEKTKLAFTELVKYPEILDLLNQNIELTVLGGDFYKKDPDLVRHHADSLNLVITRQQALELEDWKYQLENDPKAMEELKAATAEFAAEYDIDDKDALNAKEEEAMDDLYYDDAEYDYDEEIQTVEYHYYHYPYWFGYPYWYPYPYWRPYPYWYEWGFYWNPYGTVFIYNMPSPFFMHWYFYTPYHHYQYAYLSNHCINHYYGHRTSGSSVVSAVKTWRTTNREVVKEDWIADENKRIPALKEFGKMEDARITYNDKHPQEVMTSEEFVEKHEKKYPILNNPVEKTSPKYKVPNDGVDVRPQQPKNSDIKTRTPKPEIPSTSQKPVRKEKPIIKLKKAEDYHKQTWQRTSPMPPQKTKPDVASPKSTPRPPAKPQTPKKKEN